MPSKKIRLSSTILPCQVSAESGDSRVFDCSVPYQGNLQMSQPPSKIRKRSDGSQQNETRGQAKCRTVELSPKMIDKFHDDAETQFNNSRFSDVKICINGKMFQAHKVILSRNKKFDEMFAKEPQLAEIHLAQEIVDLTDLSEKSLFSKETKFDISNVSSEACVTFLRYLYNPTKIEEGKISPDLMFVAYKFDDKNLVEFCEEYLLNNVTFSNVISSLMVSLKISCEKLAKVACKLIATNFVEIKLYKDFKPVLKSDEALLAILKSLDECDVTLLTDLKNKNDKPENKIEALRSADLRVEVGRNVFLAHKKVFEKNAVLKKKIEDASTNGVVSFGIYIPQVDGKTFALYSRYIYTEELRKCDVSKKMLELAVYLKDDKLKKYCESEFCNQLNLKNAVESLVTAVKCKCEKLQKKASSFIIVRFENVLTSVDYLKILKNPDVANLVIRTSCERLQKETSKDFLHGRFILDLPTNCPVLSESFKIKGETCVVKIKRTLDQRFLSVYLEVIGCKSDLELCYTLKLISVVETRNVEKTFNHSFNSESKLGFGSQCFILWDTLVHPNCGFVKDKTVTFEFDVTAV